MSNVYLKNLREQYDGLRLSIQGLQERAAEAKRDLSPEELRSVEQQAEQAASIAKQIEDLTEIEVRNRKVAELAASVGTEVETRSEVETRKDGVAALGTQVRHRDPGHYRKDSKHSFFSDLFHARSLQDDSAKQRLVEHNRALDMATEGAGVVPPVWMTQEFAEFARSQRRVANAVRNIALSSAAPISMPKQTAGTQVVEQPAPGENTPIPNTPEWASDVDTVAPKALAGAQLVSRQMLDSSNPAVDALIFGDLVGSYNLVVEKAVVDAMHTAAGTAADSVTQAEWNGTTAAGSDAIVNAAVAVRMARKLPPDVVITSVPIYGDILKWKDAEGRPLVPLESNGPMNVIGTGSVAVDGRVHGLGLLVTDGLVSDPAATQHVLVARAADTILFESPVLRFRYEEPNGPESIRLGIWAYVATYVKYAGASVKTIDITVA